MGWTADRVELLTKLWGEGFSASQIATQLGGVTRNAVIGKVHRLKLEGRSPRTLPQTPMLETARIMAETREVLADAVSRIDVAPSFVVSPSIGRSSIRTQGATALKLEPDFDLDVRTEAAPQRQLGEVVPISRNLTLVQLSERSCKWPLGDPLLPEFRFCGNHSNDASPYCAYHARMAFQPVSERRRVR